jgi:hypothetical protein
LTIQFFKYSTVTDKACLKNLRLKIQIAWMLRQTIYNITSANHFCCKYSKNLNVTCPTLKISQKFTTKNGFFTTLYFFSKQKYFHQNNVTKLANYLHSCNITRDLPVQEHSEAQLTSVV